MSDLTEKKDEIVEEKKEEIPTQPQIPQGEESATSKIKAEALELVRAGKDLTDKTIYPAICKEWSVKYNCTYTNAVKAMKNALKDLNQIHETNSSKSQKTVGSVQVQINPQPKLVTNFSSPSPGTLSNGVSLSGSPSQPQGLITFTHEDYMDIVQAFNDGIKESKHLKDQALSEAEIKLFSKALQKSLEKRAGSGLDSLTEAQMWGIVIGEIAGLRIIFWLIDKGFDLYDKWVEDKKIQKQRDEEKPKPKVIEIQGQKIE